MGIRITSNRAACWVAVVMVASAPVHAQPPASAADTSPALPSPAAPGYAAPAPGYQTPPPGYQAPAPGYPPPAGYPSAGYPASPAPFVPPMQHRRFVMSPFASASLALFGSTYGLSVVSGAFALAIGSGDRCDHCRPVGRWFFLPLAGPFAAMHDTGTHEARVFCAVLGTAQLVGFVGFSIGSLASRGGRGGDPPPPATVAIGPGTLELRLRF